MNKMHDPALESCAKPAELASSIPPVYYTSENLVAAENETVFRSGWIGVGRADGVANPGDFVAMDIAGQNIVLLRDKNGQLRACEHLPPSRSPTCRREWFLQGVTMPVPLVVL